MNKIIDFWVMIKFWLIACYALGRVCFVLLQDPKIIGHIAKLWFKEGLSLHTLCALSAQRYPQQVAIHDDRGEVTYHELNTRVNAIAQGLSQLQKSQKKLRIGIMCRNHRGFIEILLAGARIGADVVLLHPEAPAVQLSQTLTETMLDVLVFDQEFEPVVAQSKFLGVQVLAWCDEDAACLSLEQLAIQYHTCQPPRVPQQGRLIVLTSGSSGRPKGVVRKPSMMAILAPFLTLLSTLPVRRQTVCLISIPLFHGFGLTTMLMGFWLGATLILNRKFETHSAQKQLVQHQVNIWAVVPIMLKRFLDVPETTPLPNLKAVVSGSAPLPALVAQNWMGQYGDNLYNLYGTTEVGFCCIATPKDLRQSPETVGRAALGVQIKITDAQNKPLPDGKVGRIVVGGLMVFDGYLSEQSYSYAWFDTGDLGCLDGKQCLHLYGRSDEMLVINGENIYPIEIENCLNKHPWVQESVVVQCTDEKRGQYLKALLVTNATANEDEISANLHAYLSTHIARYKIPKAFYRVAVIPKNSLGKVDKKRVREMISIF